MGSRPLLPALLALACLGPSARAQDKEFRIFHLQQRSADAAPLPGTRFRHSGFTFLWNTSKDPAGARILLTLGLGGSPSGESRYAEGQAGYGRSGTYHPAGYLAFGLRIESPGPLGFGGGLEGRVGTESRFGSWGDTAGGGSGPPDRIRPWAILALLWRPQGTPSFKPVLGLQGGLGTGDAPYPTRELGLFAGLRF